MKPNISIGLMVNTSAGEVPITPQRASLRLPGGPDSDGPVLTYGPYLEALSRFFSRDSFRPLLEALSLRMERSVDRDSIDEVEIISEKHGALYHVAKVRARVSGTRYSFAVNTAVSPEQQAFLQTEYDLLKELHRRFGLPFLPRPYLQGEGVYEGDGSPCRALHFSVAEWFEDYREFHLSRDAGGGSSVIRVWEPQEGQNVLTAEESHSLYRQAAAILTGYFDENSYEQIYPWHHAAGDFVLRRRDGDVEVRLITARDYRCLTQLGPSPEERWIAIAHFFLNMTIRIRLDRLDGTGPLAWAGENSLQGAVEGFIQAWAVKARGNSSLPSERDLLDLFRSFSPADWLPLVEVILDGSLVEADEHDFLQPRVEEHVRALAEATGSVSGNRHFER